MTVEKRRVGVNKDHARFEFPMGTGYNPDGSASLVDTVNHSLWGHHPENEIQAIMEADFCEEPRLTVEEIQASAEKVDDILETTLTEAEQLVVRCIVYGGMTLEEAGKYLARQQGLNRTYSRKTILKIRDRAYAKLRKLYPEMEDDDGDSDDGSDT